MIRALTVALVMVVALTGCSSTPTTETNTTPNATSSTPPVSSSAATTRPLPPGVNAALPVDADEARTAVLTAIEYLHLSGTYGPDTNPEQWGEAVAQFLPRTSAGQYLPVDPTPTWSEVTTPVTTTVREARITSTRPGVVAVLATVVVNGAVVPVELLLEQEAGRWVVVAQTTQVAGEAGIPEEA